jgi:hypothetical protein
MTAKRPDCSGLPGKRSPEHPVLNPGASCVVSDPGAISSESGFPVVDNDRSFSATEYDQ